MIHFLVTAANRNSLDMYFDTFGKTVSDSVEVISYEDAFNRKSWFPGTYVFSDVELLSGDSGLKAEKLWNALSETGKARLLNHPVRSMNRLELLSTLYEAGKNVFNIHRIPEIETEPRLALQIKYPVFLQKLNGKLGSSTPIIYGRRQLNEILAGMELRNINKEQYAVVEYCDTSDNKGRYRQYACFMLGDVLIQKSLNFSREWPVKISNALNNKECSDEELSYLEDTVHFHQIKDIFSHARIEYGCIDYTLLDGKIQTWGINTNPVIIGEDKLNVTTRLEISRSFADKLNGQLSILAELTGDQPVITDLELNKAV